LEPHGRAIAKQQQEVKRIDVGPRQKKDWGNLKKVVGRASSLFEVSKSKCRVDPNSYLEEDRDICP